MDGSDPIYHFCYDDKWRIVGTWRGTDTHPKELFIYHNAGGAGMGGSSYIDSVILRDRDNSSKWTQASDGTLETRHYYAQNWRADVSAIFDNSGAVIEWQKYSAYGVPFLLTPGDHEKNGGISAADQTAFNADYTANNLRADLNKDGVINSADQTLFTASYNAAAVGGRWKLSANVANRKGYAGYEHEGFGNDLAAPELAHVRHRVLHFELGRWTRRDPLGYVDGNNLVAYAAGNPAGAADPEGTNTVNFYCRPLDTWTPVPLGHCYVECCTGTVCNRYSLLNGLQNGAMRGWSCIQRNDPRDNPARPGTITVGPPAIVPGACECMDQMWRRMPGCKYKYNATVCNSNWFASAMYRCCTGNHSAPRPPSLNLPDLNECCPRSDVVPPFKCAPTGGGSFPGSDSTRGYMCGDQATW